MLGAPITTPAPRGQEVTLSAFSSLRTIDAALTKAQVLSSSTWPDGARIDYPKDQHFARYVLGAISSFEDAETFLQILNLAARRRGGVHAMECTKAYAIRHSLKGDPWGDQTGFVRSAIARGRRVNCGCHESGSFAAHNWVHHERPRHARTSPLSNAAQAA